ncbi:hypothetical protein HDU92_001143 [Lobulomyces angularis]|nr:hypothetical protein HDU92_001143 [Lobulomyces angularis]
MKKSTDDLKMNDNKITKIFKRSNSFNSLPSLLVARRSNSLTKSTSELPLLSSGKRSISAKVNNFQTHSCFTISEDLPNTTKEPLRALNAVTKKNLHFASESKTVYKNFHSFTLKTPLKKILLFSSAILFFWFLIFMRIFVVEEIGVKNNQKVGLYRILGNDLPPRHKIGQTLSNLKFILKHEENFNNCEKWWVLNRIVDKKMESEIIKILENYNQKYIKISFKLSEYILNDFRYQDFPEPDFFRSEEFKRFGKGQKIRVLDSFYHDKNQYVMNNNGARNFAIEHGKRRNDWVFPFDGNCFITQQGWKQIISTIETVGDDIKYISVPMARLLNNSHAIDKTFLPQAVEEPQVIFRKSSQEVYNSSMRYGRRSKLELLWRLGIQKAPEGMWKSKSSFSWETETKNISADFGKFGVGGFVMRLFSGSSEQEMKSSKSAGKRAHSRVIGIQNLIDSIDESIGRNRLDFKKMAFYDEISLQKERLTLWSMRENSEDVDKRVVDKIKSIFSESKKILEETDKYFDNSIDFENSDKHSDAHLERKNVIPLATVVQWIWNDKVPLTVNNKFKNEYLQDIQKVLNQIQTLSLAWFYDGDGKWAIRAGNLLRLFLIDSAVMAESSWGALITTSGTIFHNSLNEKIDSFGGDEIALESTPLPHILHNLDITPVLDGIRLLTYRAKVFTKTEQSKIKQLFSGFLEFLTRHPLGFNASKQKNSAGVQWELQVASLALFLDDMRDFLKIAHRSKLIAGGYHMDLVNLAANSEFSQNANMYIKNCINSQPFQFEAGQNNANNPQEREAIDEFFDLNIKNNYSCMPSSVKSLIAELELLVKLSTLSRLLRNAFKQKSVEFWGEEKGEGNHQKLDIGSVASDIWNFNSIHPKAINVTLKEISLSRIILLHKAFLEKLEKSDNVKSTVSSLTLTEKLSKLNIFLQDLQFSKNFNVLKNFLPEAHKKIYNYSNLVEIFNPTKIIFNLSKVLENSIKSLKCSKWLQKILFKDDESSNSEFQNVYEMLGSTISQSDVDGAIIGVKWQWELERNHIEKNITVSLDNQDDTMHEEKLYSNREILNKNNNISNEKYVLNLKDVETMHGLFSYLLHSFVSMDEEVEGTNSIELFSDLRMAVEPSKYQSSSVYSTMIPNYWMLGM